jgi:hemoglobin-like flavoprotein
VKPEHFPVAEAALVGALEETLGAEFDDDSRGAWTRTIQCLASAMQGGGQ